MNAQDRSHRLTDYFELSLFTNTYSTYSEPSLYNVTTFIITAKFIIMSVWSAQKSADCVSFHCYSHVNLQENIPFVYLLESPRPGDSNKYTKGMIHKKTVQKYPLFIL